MYSKHDYLIEETEGVIENIRQIIRSYDCSLMQISSKTGVSYRCLKYIYYGTDVDKEYVAPRYDRVIRLLAGRYLPEDILLAEGKVRCDVLEDWVQFCVSPIRTAAAAKLLKGSVGALEGVYIPSPKRLERIAKGKFPPLDFVIRMLKGGSISINSLVPSFSDSATEEITNRLLSWGLTEENTLEFFAALRDLFLPVFMK